MQTTQYNKTITKTETKWQIGWHCKIMPANVLHTLTQYRANAVCRLVCDLFVYNCVHTEFDKRLQISTCKLI